MMLVNACVNDGGQDDDGSGSVLAVMLMMMMGDKDSIWVLSSKDNTVESPRTLPPFHYFEVAL